MSSRRDTDPSSERAIEIRHVFIAEKCGDLLEAEVGSFEVVESEAVHRLYAEPLLGSPATSHDILDRGRSDSNALGSCLPNGCATPAIRFAAVRSG